jgi:hypothetical protein
MGWFGGDDTEVQAEGINQNVIVTEPVNVESREIITLLFIICVIKVLELLYVCIGAFKRNIKKKYIQSNGLSLANKNQQGP